MIPRLFKWKPMPLSKTREYVAAHDGDPRARRQGWHINQHRVGHSTGTPSIWGHRMGPGPMRLQDNLMCLMGKPKGKPHYGRAPLQIAPPRACPAHGEGIPVLWLRCLQEMCAGDRWKPRVWSPDVLVLILAPRLPCDIASFRSLCASASTLGKWG